MPLGSIALQLPSAPYFALLALFAFLPPVLYVAWIRNTERYGREPWSSVASSFLWGAVAGIVIGVILSLVLQFLLAQVEPLYAVLARRFTDPATVLGVLVVAPFCEEGAKALGVFRVRRIIREPEDGFVYGATVGLGFSATENLLYGIVAFLMVPEAPFTAAVLAIAVRSVSSCLVHASATSLTGYGIARRHLWGSRFSVLPWYLGAVAIHAGFNALATFGIPFTDQFGDIGQLFGVAAAVLFALIAISLVRGKILDHEAREDWIK
ncbi:MAG: hypothetical protein A3K65_02480 [Euryarchaeota archaeon RBG_16_68_12]|nr:MAG: hypothetical protein A3K65_02480 [Euryarchaeota archaeon RBG_16_68_12]